MFSVRPFENRTLSWWSDERRNIDLEPTYQRKGRIWSTSEKAFLIDSVLNGYDVPKIYIADFTYFPSDLNRAKKAYAVIDGRQRFEAFFDFFDDRFGLSDSFVYLEDLSVRIAGLNYSQLKSRHPKIASRFENFNLSVMSVITDDEARINDLFVRLNSSKPLSGAEVRNAMAGDVPILVREIAQHEFFTQKVSFNINRRQDHNAAAKLLLLEYRGALVDTKKVNLDRFVKEAVRSESTAIGAAAARVSEQLDRLTPLFEDKDLALKLATGLPVYYWYFRTNEATSQTVQNLRAFENARKSNKQAASLGESELVAEDLQLYDYFNRSPDDATSHERRLQILSKWMNSHAADGVA
jgi:hypothetical protein